jgi:hypothetical protein
MGDDVMTKEAYADLLIKQISEAAVEAWNRRAPGALSWGRGYAVVGFNRRTAYFDGSTRMYGKTDAADFSIRLSLRPVVLRSYATKWIKHWVWTQYQELNNLELAQAMYPSDIPFDNACRMFWKAVLNGYNEWQVRYILVREVLFGNMAVRKPAVLCTSRSVPVSAIYNKYRSMVSPFSSEDTIYTLQYKVSITTKGSIPRSLLPL